MEGVEQAKALLAVKRYREAAVILDRLIVHDREKDELWYLRGIASLKMRNYSIAQECFEHAVSLGRKPRYYQIKGMAHFELFEMDEAIGSFLSALALEPNDATTNFFLSMCYLFIDDPRADEYIAKARKADRKKTSQLLLNFYTFFLKDDPRINDSVKKRMEDRIRELK